MERIAYLAVLCCTAGFQPAFCPVWVIRDIFGQGLEPAYRRSSPEAAQIQDDGLRPKVPTGHHHFNAVRWAAADIPSSGALTFFLRARKFHRSFPLGLALWPQPAQLAAGADELGTRDLGCCAGSLNGALLFLPFGRTAQEQD
jgi:hypothetical protein